MEADGVRIGEFVRTNNKSQEALWCVENRLCIAAGPVVMEARRLHR